MSQLPGVSGSAPSYTFNFFGANTMPTNGGNRARALVEGFDLGSDSPIVPVTQAIARLLAVKRRICDVIADVGTRRRRVLGTGFLIGPDLVLSSFHLFHGIVNGLTAPERVNFSFENATLSDTDALPTTSGLAADWLVARSPEPRNPLAPSADELDFVVVRLNESVGDSSRGYLSLTAITTIEKNQPVVIVHGAGDASPTVSFGPVVEVKDNSIRYRASTVNGSSGSPVHDQTMTLIALHRGSIDGQLQRDGKPVNDGIPIGKIADKVAEVIDLPGPVD